MVSNAFFMADFLPKLFFGPYTSKTPAREETLHAKQNFFAAAVGAAVPQAGAAPAAVCRALRRTGLLPRGGRHFCRLRQHVSTGANAAEESGPAASAAYRPTLRLLAICRRFAVGRMPVTARKVLLK